MKDFRGIVISLLFARAHDARTDLGLFLLRSLVGAALAVHGHGKFLDVGAFAQEFSIPLPLAYAATLTQLMAGALVIVGLLTPLACVALASTMLVATGQLIARGESWISPHGHSFEASFFYLGANLVLLICGPGAFSVDAALHRNWAQVSAGFRESSLGR